MEVFKIVRKSNKAVFAMVFVIVATVAFAHSTAVAFDPKACYVKCMDEIDDHAKCERICFNKDKK